MSTIGLDPNADESNKLREVLELCPQGDRQRMMDLFRAQLDIKPVPWQRDWSDDSKDGPRNAPVPVAAQDVAAVAETVKAIAAKA